MLGELGKYVSNEAWDHVGQEVFWSRGRSSLGGLRTGGRLVFVRDRALFRSTSFGTILCVLTAAKTERFKFPRILMTKKFMRLIAGKNVKQKFMEGLVKFLK